MNTGAFDPLDEIVPIAHERGAWVHVDGAFGIWAAGVPSLQRLMRGHREADSWSTDAHKWLNVPYDSGLVVRARRRSAPRRDDARCDVLRRGRGRRSVTATTGPRSRRAGHAASPSSQRFARSGDPGSSSSSNATARWRVGWPTALCDRSAGRDPQRRRAQPGPRPLRCRARRPGRQHRRCAHPRGHRRRPARRHLLARRDDVGRSRRDADLHLGLADDRRPTSTARRLRSSDAWSPSTPPRCGRSEDGRERTATPGSLDGWAPG